MGVETRPLIREEWARPAPTGFDLAAELFDDDMVGEMGVELSPDATEALRDDPFTTVEGTFVYRGVRFEPVGVHLKGNNSFLPIDAKPSLKIDLNEYVPGLDLLGLQDLTLDAMNSDASMMRERLAYRAFREAGLPASRAAHVQVSIDGEPRGLYTLVETVNDELLELWWPDPTGTLWEMPDVDFVDEDVPSFELESGADDRGPIAALADALELDPELVVDAADPWVSWEDFVTFTATTAVVGQFDSYPWRTPGDDVHLYFDPADGRGRFLPHGLDETFKRKDVDVFSGAGLLLQACLATPACRTDYEAALLDVQSAMEAFDLHGYALQVQQQIRPLVEEDPARPYTLDQVDSAQELVLSFVETRRERLEGQIGGRP